MKEPVLVIMAAGLGSRYGGLKQMDSVSSVGEWIIDYSLYDACLVGFREVVFIVRESILEDFKATIGKRIEGSFKTSYAVQTLEDLPAGYNIPSDRTKPWGTAHAVYSARAQIGDSPFMVINADDYYGRDAFQQIYTYLSSLEENQNTYECAMVGFLIKNTVSLHGHVARGVCRADSSGYLAEIIERTNIQVFDDGIKYSEDGGESWILLPDNTPVSLNCWGFPANVIDEIDSSFRRFLDNTAKANSTTSEFFLPSLVEELMLEGKARVKILDSHEKWYGVTYREDKDHVSTALEQMKLEGFYPDCLWQSNPI